MRNDKDVMVNLELVEYMRKMILQSVTQGVWEYSDFHPSELPVSLADKSYF